MSRAVLLAAVISCALTGSLAAEEVAPFLTPEADSGAEFIVNGEKVYDPSADLYLGGGDADQVVDVAPAYVEQPLSPSYVDQPALTVWNGSVSVGTTAMQSPPTTQVIDGVVYEIVPDSAVYISE